MTLNQFTKFVNNIAKFANTKISYEKYIPSKKGYVKTEGIVMGLDIILIEGMPITQGIIVSESGHSYVAHYSRVYNPGV